LDEGDHEHPRVPERAKELPSVEPRELAPLAHPPRFQHGLARRHADMGRLRAHCLALRICA
jgi:hypothetical protein